MLFILITNNIPIINKINLFVFKKKTLVLNVNNKITYLRQLIRIIPFCLSNQINQLKV
jgi:hypothetical protein